MVKRSQEHQFARHCVIVLGLTTALAVKAKAATLQKELVGTGLEWRAQW
jgi:hypothetical protein